MNDSLRIGSVFGITIRVHVLFLVMVAALVLLAPSPAMQLAAISMLFVLVFLHELGHSLVAQSFGIRVLDITFWPLGGMARMSDIPEEPRVEGLIAVAGPAVNFALALLGIGFWALLRGVEGLTALDASGVLGSPLALFVVFNLLLGTFNLVPAFPMDGGRILRAFLARRRTWVEATELAVRVGRWVAFAMALWGLWSGNCMLVLIAGFVWLVGARELAMVRLRHLGNPFGLGGMPFGGARGPFGDGGPFAPGGPFAGSGPFAPRDVETDEPSDGGARRPTVLDVDRPAGKGFSDEDVRRLEDHPGRLRRPRED